MSKGKALGLGKTKDQGPSKDVSQAETGAAAPAGSVDGGGECSCTDVKTFSFDGDGLSYSVRIHTEMVDGVEVVKATVELESGHMDVNAVYWGDSDVSGKSASLGGPLNMNGGGSLFNGEKVEWDGAVPASQPGLGPQGASKPTYLDQPGDSYTITLGDLSQFGGSLDSIDFIGVRATSTSTPEGSIKGVSDCEDTPVPPDPVDLGKVFFKDAGPDGSGVWIGGDALADEPANGEFYTLEDYVRAAIDSGEYEGGNWASGMLVIRIDQYDSDSNLISSTEFEGTLQDLLDALTAADHDDDAPLPLVMIDEDNHDDENQGEDEFEVS